MVRPKATPEHRQEVQRSIREAATSLYETGGGSAVSARSVALKAGVSVGTLYAHFGDLSGLMQAIWAEQVKQQNIDFRAIVEQHTDNMEQLRALLLTYLDFGFENGELYRGAFVYIKPNSDRRPFSAPLDATNFPALLVETIKACQETNDIRQDDPALIAQILWSGLHGCIALPVHIDKNELVNAEKLSRPMVESLLRGVAP